ncbi:MAG: gliding motility-associated C-terminal domain-containing protein [Bacteroidetes bacterium]|nr:gliding motility-associated C-terminal domain-containing protein [Bacteroidota bacterium]
MKKIALLSALLFFSFGKLISQNADCIDAILLCSTPSFTFFSTQGDGNISELPGTNSISNPNTNPFSPQNAGCLLAGENSPQWLLISVGNAGVLEFVFGAANGPNPQAGYYDWAMWPYDQSSCAGIMNNTLPPIRCNWNFTNAGGTGVASASNIPAGGSSGNFEPPIPVEACDQFIICISNYSGVNSLVSFQSIGTASLSCDPSCSQFEICAGNNVTITPVNVANLTNASYSLNPGGLSNSTGTFIVSPLTSLTYTSYVTGINSINAVVTNTGSIAVIVHPQPTVSTTYSLSTCTSTVSAFDMNFGFVAPTPTPAPTYTIDWGATPNTVTSNTQTAANNVMAGNYPYTITAQGGCEVIGTVSISPQPAQANFTFFPFGNSFSVNCAQPVINISTSNAALNYTWTNTNTGTLTGSTTALSTANLGTWTVNAVHPVSGCTETHTFFAGQDFTPPIIASISHSLQQVTCANPLVQTMTMTAGSPTQNIVHIVSSAAIGGSVSLSTASTAIYYPIPGSYDYWLLNSVNGCSTHATFSVTTSPDFPVFSISSTGTLSGQGNYTVGCTPFHHLTVINIVNPETAPTPGGAMNFGFLPPGSTSTVIPPVGSQFSVVSTPGTWTVLVTSVNNSCTAMAPVTIVQNTVSPDISAIVPTQILDCFTPSVTLMAQTTNSAAAFAWGISGQQTLPGSTLTVHTTTNTNSTSAGIFTLTITDQNNGCISNSLIPIQQNLFTPMPKISVTNNTITCTTPTLQLSNSSLTGILPNSGFATNKIIQVQLWDGPSPQQTVSIISSYVAAVPGTYTMTVKDLNNGCNATTITTIQDGRVYPVMTNTVPFIMDCGEKNVLVYPSMTNTTTNFSFLWNGPQTNTFTGATNTRSVTVNAIGLYKILVTNLTNGCAAAGVVSVTSGSLTADVLTNDAQGFAPHTVKFFNNSSSTTGSSSITTVWSFGNGTSGITLSASDPTTAVYTQPGTYTATIYVVKGLCSDTVSKIINVDIPSKLEVPNVFTPNGDGVNDIFFLKATNLTQISIKIYDRWGHLAYEVESSTGNIAWDGKNIYGKEAAAGTYFYIISAKGKDDKDYEQKGNVTLVR